MKISIRHQLIIMICSLLCLAIFFTLAFSYTLISLEYEAKMKHNNAVMAESLSSNISQFMYNASNINQMLAEYPNLMEMNVAEQKKLLAGVVEKYPWFQLLAITDLEGNQVARSSGFEGNRADRPWFKRFMATKQYYISNTYYSVTTESPITTIVHGIYSGDRLAGVMMADIEVNRLQQMVEKCNYGEGSYAYLLDGNGAVIAHPDRRQVADLYNYKTAKKKVVERDENGRMLKDGKNNELTHEEEFAIPDSLRLIVEKVMHGQIGIGEYTTFDGEVYVCAYRTVDLPGTSDKWSLIVVQKENTAMAFMNNVMIKTTGGGVIIVIFSILLTLWFSRKLTRPLVSIVDATNRIKEGDLKVRIASASSNEIGVLAENFNNMVDTLRENHKEREVANEKIRRLAFHDGLTGLPNRMSLNDYLAEKLAETHREGTKGAIFFIDIDDFKLVNDNFGHSFGDEFLMKVSWNIMKAVGEDAFVARWGGDEFIAIVPNQGSCEVIAKIAENLIAHLTQEYQVSVEKMHMSASIGVVIYPKDGDTQEDLLKKADSAMYAAKKAGRNCWRFYEESLMQEGYENMLMTNELRQGLAKNEFFLHYQPQFTSDGKVLVGFEALLRWNYPTCGLIPPDRFIPLAEQSKLILWIGKWVIEEACKFAGRLSGEGRDDLRVAVNISPRQLAAEDFVATIRGAIREAGIQPQQIEIEITENVFIESMEESAKKLFQLKDIGLMLSLDDFGMGYSSLNYLRELPVKMLKIDKSFIDRITFDDAQYRVANAIIDLGHKLGMTIVIEGVEKQEQLDILAAFGCDRVQGYVFSKPLPEEEAMRLLRKYKRY